MLEVQPFSDYFPMLKLKDDAEGLAKAVAEWEEKVKNFEAFLELHAVGDGPFLGGADMNFAEASMAPFVQRCVPYFRELLKVDVLEKISPYPRVAALIAAILERPAVVKTGVPEDEAVEGIKTMLKRFA
mmetsp:Transcript_10357/g.30953  ORF Transcript_10357/g.30953 Transcript_10357/m.30953 type:complete len:129 (+) Transcript_10357:459-845(+)